jgi:hypothetical protein
LELWTTETASSKARLQAGHQWLKPIILATQEAEIRRITVQSQPGKIVCETLSQKIHHKKGLVEWLEVKALNSSPSTTKTKNKKQTNKKKTQLKKICWSLPSGVLILVR